MMFVIKAEPSPLKLKELCRSVIRVLLRASAENEKPLLEDTEMKLASFRYVKRESFRCTKILLMRDEHDGRPDSFGSQWFFETGANYRRQRDARMLSSSEDIIFEAARAPANTGSDPSTSHSTAIIGSRRRRAHNSSKRSAEENDGERSNIRRMRTVSHIYAEHFPSLDSEEFRRNFIRDNFDEYSGDPEIDSYHKDYLSCYSYRMTEKIRKLPLPACVKMYLNFSRPL